MSIKNVKFTREFPSIETTPAEEALYVVARLLITILRSDLVHAHRLIHLPEVTRAVDWASDAFGGIDKLGHATGAIQREQQALEKAARIGAAHNDINDVLVRVLNEARCLSPYTVGNGELADRVQAAITNHIHDMVKRELISTLPEEPLPDACLAIDQGE